MNKIMNFFINKKIMFDYFTKLGIHNCLSDEIFLKKKFKIYMGKNLDLNNPKTFNEKLQWLKINDRKPIYTIMVDKYEAKKYVASIIGEEYIIPTLGIYDNFDQINFDSFPNQFVIKCTHDSGGLVIVKDKTQINIQKVRKKINKCLKRNYYWSGREWPYKNVKPRIIIEKYMEDQNTEDLKDYKFFCFGGVPKIILVCSERFSSSNMCETWFDDSWNLLPIKENNHGIDKSIKCPLNFEKMKNLASILSKDIPFVRIDFYEIKNEIYFGEITFFPASGYEKFDPEEWDEKMGDLIELKINE